MRIHEVIINLIQRWGVVSNDSLASLNIQLSTEYTKKLENYKMKTEQNPKIEAEIIQFENIANQHDEHSPEYQKAATKIADLKQKLQEPTIFEKAIYYLDKPLVRLALIAVFLFLSRMFVKSLFKQNDDEDEQDAELKREEELKAQQQQTRAQYNPYGSYQAPPPPPQFIPNPYYNQGFNNYPNQ